MQPKKKVKDLLPLFEPPFFSVITCKIEIFLLNQKKNNLLKKKKSRKKFESLILNLEKIIKLSSFGKNFLSYKLNLLIESNILLLWLKNIFFIFN